MTFQWRKTLFAPNSKFLPFIYSKHSRSSILSSLAIAPNQKLIAIENNIFNIDSCDRNKNKISILRNPLIQIFEMLCDAVFQYEQTSI